MPQYNKTTWVNDTAPAIDATNLNKIEQGIFDSVRQDGSTTMSGQLVTTAGSASTPAIAPTGDSNTGIFFPAADTIAFGEGGTEVMRITSAGNVGIGTVSPVEKLHISGGGIIVTGDVASINANALLMGYNSGTGEARIATGGVSGASSFLTFTTSNAGTEAEKMRITSAGNVGIGTQSPAVSGLEISRATGTATPTPAELRISTTSSASDWSTVNPWGRLSFYSGDASGGGAKIHASIDAVSQGTSGGVSRIDFKISDGQATPALWSAMTILSTASSTPYVGIGTETPAAELHAKGIGEIVRLETTTASGNGANYLSFYDPSGLKGAVGFTTSSDEFRIINSKDTSLSIYTNGTARLLIENGGTTRPSSNNTYELGSATYRWSTIYAQNALNTSDERLKTDIAESSLGLEFVNTLNPVQFRYIEGGNTVERVQTGTEIVEITPAIPAQPEVPEIVDEEGNVIQAFVPATEEVAAVTEERPTYEEVITPRDGVRTHFGLLAQEVKAALPDGLDFAGWALADKDDAESTQFLGYSELIAPMIKAIQELNAKVEALEAQLAGN